MVTKRAATATPARADRIVDRTTRVDQPYRASQNVRVHGANALVSHATARPDRAEATSAQSLRAAPPAPVARPRAPFVGLVIGVVILGVIGIMVLNTKIYENAFRLQDLQDRQSSLDRQEQQLSQQLADKESPNNLAAAATSLGLVPAGTPAFIRLPDGRVLGVPQPAGQSGR